MQRDGLPARLCPQVLAYLDNATGRARLIATARKRGGSGPAARLLDYFRTSLVVPPLRYVLSVSTTSASVSDGRRREFTRG